MVSPAFTPFLRRPLRATTAALVAACTMSMACPAAFAQTAPDLQGSVTDPSGNLLPKATINAQNEATGKTAHTTTDAQGHFDLAGLPVGTYTVTVNAPGFAVAVKKQVQVASDHADTA